MFKNHKFVDRSILFIGDALLAFFFSLHFCRFVLKGKFYFTHEYYWMVPTTMLSFVIYLYIFERYEYGRLSKPKNEAYQSFGLAFIFVIVVLLISILYINTSFSRSKLIFSMVSFPLLYSLWRFGFRKIISKNRKPIESLLIYSTNDSQGLNNEIKKSFNKAVYVKDIAEWDSEKLNNKRDMVVILLPENTAISESISSKLNNIFFNSTIVTSFVSAYTEIKEAVPLRLGNNYLYNLLGYSISKYTFHHKIFVNTINLVFSILMFFVAGITALFLVILNPFFNRGPLIYRQKRLGKDQKEFYIYKFRTMVINAEKNGPRMANKNDNRITSIGKFLRKTRLDETPQFFNVLKGDMNLIGPRPERKTFADELVKVCFLYHYRHRIKPGITGWAQVKYKYGENLEDSIIKLEYDLFYVRRKNIILDIRILLKTISSILLAKGT